MLLCHGVGMHKKITDLVQGAGELITLPDVFIRISRLIENPASTTDDIAQAVSKDPAFTVRLLRVANSSYYGFSSSIDTVAKAVSIIGTSQIRNLALSTSVASSFSGLSNKLVTMDNFWRHSLYCGLVARKLASQRGYRTVLKCGSLKRVSAGYSVLNAFVQITPTIWGVN